MRIVLDGRGLLQSRSVPGVARVATQLAAHLPLADPTLEVSLFFNFVRDRHLPTVRAVCPPGIKARICRIPPQLVSPLLAAGMVPVELFAGRLDVFHSLLFAPSPRALRGRIVVTIYDVIPVRHPESVHPTWLPIFRAMLDAALKRADLILVPTEFTRQDLLQATAAVASRVHRVPIGVGPEFREPIDGDRIAKVRDKYSLPEVYILAVGMPQPHKNIPRVLEAFLAQRDHLGPEAALVLAGPASWDWPTLRARLEAMQPGKRLRLLGYVPDVDLPALMAGARCLAQVSLYEGFGIPALEAMAVGTPVVASRGTAVAEVVGDAALLADPQDVREIGLALVEAAQDEATRARLSAAGRTRAAQFSWNRVARETVAAYTAL